MAKRRYEAHFVSKLTDCDGFRLVERSYSSERECNETDSSLDFARDCGYVSCKLHEELSELNNEVGRMLGAMIKEPTPFLLRF